MDKQSGAMELAKLIEENPMLPVRVMVSKDLYNEENINYDMGEIAWCIVDAEYRGKNYLYFESSADYRDTLADACRKGDMPYKPDSIYSEAFSDAKIKRLYKALPWKRCILLYVE